MKRRMKSELGPDWQSPSFQSFRARRRRRCFPWGKSIAPCLPDGTDVACKLQYPDMSSAVEADLRQLAWAFGVYRSYDKAIDPSGVFVELSARLREELDYVREARHLAPLRRDARTRDPSSTSRPCTKRIFEPSGLLTMSWVHGKPVDGLSSAAARRSKARRDRRTRTCSERGMSRSTTMASSTVIRTSGTTPSETI